MTADTLTRRPATPVNPYVGPRAFGPEERLPNREYEAREVADLLIAERVILLHSPSGAGKTSLIQAAVMPILADEGFQVLGPVRVDKPVSAEGVHNRYINSLAQYLLNGSAGAGAELGRLTLREVLVRAFPPLAVRGYTDRPPVLVIDQLEEVLVLDPTDWLAKERFFKELGAALRRERLWALLSMREDYMGGLYRYLRFVPGHLRARYRLDFLTPQEALAAAQKPAAEQGVRFADDAARLLVEELAHTTVQNPSGDVERRRTPYVEPFQLQVACRQLWKQVRRTRGDNFRVIDENDVARIDVDKALSRYYTDSVVDVEQRFGVPQRVVREWFETNLITAQQFRSQTTTGPVPGTQGIEVVRRLREAYLIREDTRVGTTWYELAHDRLIAAVLYSNRIWRHSELDAWQRAAWDWQRSNRQRDFLLNPAELRQALSVGTRNLVAYEREFVRESEEAVRRAGLVTRAHSLISVVGVIAVVEFVVIAVLLLVAL